jgi:hypothetical protein
MLLIYARVNSLYSRAVEVLLDTWNIKGHDPLSLKEAVPQLACVAFQLMRAGKQTATEKELLLLLEEARERVPQIRRYTKDSPHEFLKRVELRSSLLLEAGHQIEAGRTVPFYQFRHLTFQEYLAAVAAAEGHYIDYNKDDTVLTPLATCLTAEKWKEVVPMAAVLARKQAEPLMVALIEQGCEIKRQMESNQAIQKEKAQDYSIELVPPVARLVQCLIEEAEAAPETLTQALQLVAYFADGCNSEEDWQALSRGPYGEELLHQAWLFFSGLSWKDVNPLNTCTFIASQRWGRLSNGKDEAEIELKRLLVSDIEEEIARGLFTIAGQISTYLSYRDRPDPKIQSFSDKYLDFVEKHLFNDSLV